MEPADCASLLERLAATPQVLERVLRELPEWKLRTRAAPASFAPIEVAWHLRDLECEGWRARMCRILDEPTPILASIDGDRLATERSYLTLELEPALAQFADARRQSVEILRTLPAHRWSWSGIFEGQPLTLARLAELMVQHDVDHLDGLHGHAVKSQAA
ncbi:MAG TPA: DinB family protein [Steroidobacteraceae bacterium]|nr:DinB family protein [Steroidobacteraceae bacterium]